MTESQPVTRKGLALALLAAAQFVVVLDASIVNVALPSIGRDLDFSQENLSWVVNAYTLVFGGFLLLGGRMADLLGRRRVFTVGLILFAFASLLGGLAASEGQLIAARALQGLGAAILSPAALSILTTTFAEGAERNRALGVWGAVAGSGGAVGVLLGGVLTEYLGWEWVLFVNVPIALFAAAMTSRLLPESRETGARRYDVAGAVSITAGISLLVYALVDAVNEGWGSIADARPDRDLARAGRRVRRHRAALEPPADLVRDLPQAHPDRRQHRRGAGRDVAVQHVLLRLALHAAGARLRRAEGRRRLPAAGGRDHHLGRRRLPARHEGGLQARDGGRVRARRRRPDRGSPRCRPSGTYLGDVLFPSLLAAVGLGLVFVPLTIAAVAGVSAAGVRARERADQHLPAGRRRARPRHPRDDRELDHAGRDGRGRRRQERPARGADRRVPGRLHRRRGLRDPRRDPDGGADLEPRPAASTPRRRAAARSTRCRSRLSPAAGRRARPRRSAAPGSEAGSTGAPRAPTGSAPR